MRSATWRDFWRLILAILIDNNGFHQFHLLCRVVGTVEYFFGRRDLGRQMERMGNNEPHSEEQATPAT